jgi:hypothetical protein
LRLLEARTYPAVIIEPEFGTRAGSGYNYDSGLGSRTQITVSHTDLTTDHCTDDAHANANNGASPAFIMHL